MLNDTWSRNICLYKLMTHIPCKINSDMYLSLCKKILDEEKNIYNLHVLVIPVLVDFRALIHPRFTVGKNTENFYLLVLCQLFSLRLAA